MLIRMSIKERVTVSLPADVVAAAKAASDGNLSAYIEQAVRTRTLMDAGAAVTAWRAGREADAEELADVFGQDVA
jgi:predicted TIM-barrel enzyme